MPVIKILTLLHPDALFRPFLKSCGAIDSINIYFAVVKLKKMKFRYKILICLLASSLISGCVSTRSAEELRGIQQNEGFVSTELDYVGSTGAYHYFEQEKGRREQAEIIKWTKLYRVPKGELSFTDVDEMPYKLTDDKKVKVKISSAQPYTLRRCKNRHQEYEERIREYKERAKGLKERMSSAITGAVGGSTSGVQLPSAPANTSEKEP